MIRVIIIVLILVASARAELIMLNDSATGRVWTNSLPEAWRVVDFGVRGNDDLVEYRRADYPEPAEFPSAVDTDTR